MIEVSEKVIMDSFSSASRRQMEILEESAWYIDVGNINCNSTNWAMLVYLPSPKVPMIGITEFTKRYIHDSMYMSALEKLKNYLNRLNHIGIIEHMNKYVEFCMKFYLESDLTNLTSEQLYAGKYCIPEREVSHWFSDQWEDALST